MNAVLRIMPAALCLLLFCASARGEEWNLITSDASGDHFIDTERITHPRTGEVMVHVKLVHSDRSNALYTETYGDKFAGLKVTTSMWYLRCATREIALSSLTHKDLLGRTIHRFDNRDPEWEPIEPGSVGTLIHALVCLKEK